MLNQDQQDRAMEMLAALGGKLNQVQCFFVAWVEPDGGIKYHRSGPAVMQIGMLVSTLDDVRHDFQSEGTEYNPREED